MMALFSISVYSQRISELPPASTVDSSNLFVIVQNGVTKKITYEDLVSALAADSNLIVAFVPESYWTLDGSSLYPVDTTNFVGIGTTTPGAQLEVVGTADIVGYFHTSFQNPGDYLFTIDPGEITTPYLYSGLDSNNFTGVVVCDSTLVANETINIPKTTATVGQIKQNGYVIFHTYNNQTEGYNEPNIFLGKMAGNTSMTGRLNIGVGYQALLSNTSGKYNTVIGHGSLVSNTTGDYNVLMGSSIAQSYTDNDNNVMIGMSAGALGSYDNCVGIGYESLYRCGNNNTAIGYQSGFGINTGIGNTMIGYQAGYNETGSNKLYIENSNADSANALIFGNFSTNALRFNADITYGDSFWDDLTTSAAQAKIGANSKPPYNYDSLTLVWEATDTTTNYLVFNYQLPHRWKAGTNVSPHVHYTQKSASDTCEWFIILYKWTDLGENQASSWTRLHSTNQTYFAYSSGAMHQLADFPDIAGSGHTESSILDIKLYCWADAALSMKQFDIHFEIDKPGSDNEIP